MSSDSCLSSVSDLALNKAAGTVQLFDRGEYHSAFGADAALIADRFYRSKGLIRTFRFPTGIETDMVHVSRRQLGPLLRRLLLELQCRVELYKPVDGQFRVTAKGSPGNQEELEELMETGVEGDEGVGVLAVIPSTAGFSAAFVHMDSLSIRLGGFSDGPQSANLKGMLAALNPREVLISATESPENNGFAKYCQNQLLYCARRKAAEFTSSGVVAELNKVLKFPSVEMSNAAQLSLVSESSDDVMKCVGAVVRYLELGKRDSFSGRFRLEALPPPGEAMRLHPAALRALDLLASDCGRETSLLKLLERSCVGAGGRRRLEAWLRQPSTQLRQLKERQDAVAALIEEVNIRDRLRQTLLPRLPDLLAVARRLLKAKGTLQDCFRVYQALQLVKPISDSLAELADGCPDYSASVLAFLNQPLTEIRDGMGKFAELVETTLDMERVENEREFRIRADFDPNLADLAYKIGGIEDDMRDELTIVSRKLSLEPGKTIKLEISGPSGPCFKVTLKEEKSLRGVKGLQILDTVKAAVRFTNARLAKLAEAHSESSAEYEETSSEIVSHVVSTAASYTEALSRLSEALGTVDATAALAETAVSAYPPWVRPRLLPLGERRLMAKGLRHPVVEAAEDASFIPNDVRLESPDSRLLVVTGPNAGGKSTYLRSVGLAVVLAQMGSFVPADEIELSLCDGVFTRIGASDDESRGLSTFMAEMLETSIIVESATSNSLVIVDELGRGTSTWDGLGLAWAIAEHLLLTNGGLTLFATHLHQLAQLAEQHAGVRNLHASFLRRDGELTLLYKIAEGACDESFGLSVAEMLKFPPQVIQEAKEYMEEDTSSVPLSQSEMDRVKKMLEEKDVEKIRSYLESLS